MGGTHSCDHACDSHISTLNTYEEMMQLLRQDIVTKEQRIDELQRIDEVGDQFDILWMAS